jgi:SAM-dependent methyltransferase
MLKMYHPSADVSPGGSAEYWEGVWSEDEFDEALRFCEIDPLRGLFEEFLKPGALALEGGCGRGQYVAYYTARGARVVGLDFAATTLQRLRRNHGDLRLCVGDVGRLPFRSASLKTYYSGGVVEHFEKGPLEALREARRVLTEDGVLLVSVPYQSPLRGLLAFSKGDRRRVGRTEEGAPQNRGGVFFQYAFTRREFTDVLEQAGFTIMRTQGYAIYFGLMELPLVGSLLGRVQRRRTISPSHAAVSPSAAESPLSAAPSAPSLAKRLLVREDVSVPVAGRAVKFLRWAAANMMMYVCTPSRPGPA